MRLAHRGLGLDDGGAHHRKLAAHIGCLALDAQHLDLGNDFLVVELARQFGFAIEQLERFGKPGFRRAQLVDLFFLLRFLLRYDISVLREFAHMRVENAFLGFHRARRKFAQFGSEIDLAGSPGFSLETLHPRGHRAAAFADFAELRRKICILDPGERLVLDDDGPFLHHQLADDAAFQRLHHLHLARRDHPAVAALHLVQHGKVRPHEKRHQQRQ